MHNTHRLSRLVTLCLGLLLPMGVFAAPANVTGIAATKTADGVQVSWDSVPDAVSYKIFWSRESILENDALFDDTVDTESDDTTYTLRSLPAMDDVYVTVLAVDANGAESDLFEEEAHASLAAASSSAMYAPTVTSSAPATGAALHALKVDVPSPTTIIVTFSLPVTLDQQTARTAFAITDGAGNVLQIARIKTDGTTAELTTLPQERQRAYRLHIDSSLKGRSSTGDAVVGLAADQTDLLFVGHASGSAAVVQQPTGGTGDVQQVQVRAAPDGRNTYTVEVSWQPPQGSAAAGYRVAQTVDGGRTYSQPQLLAAAVQSVRIPGTQAGELGLLIQAVDALQQPSRGVLQRIVLPQTSGAPARTTVTPPPRSTVHQNSHLPQTGVGTVSLLAIAGAFTGAHMQRKKKRQA